MRRDSLDPKVDMGELFNRVACTVLVSNVDNHLKKHRHHQSQGNWILYPVFDVNASRDCYRELKTHAIGVSGCKSSVDTLVDHAHYSMWGQ